METETTPKPEICFQTADVIFSFVMIVCGFLYWNLIHWTRLGAGVTVFAALLFAISFLYLSKSSIRQNKSSTVCLILAVLSAVQFSLFDNQFIKALNFLFLSAVFVYWICLSTGHRIDTKLSIYIIGDTLNQGVIIPFSNFLCCASGMQGFIKFSKGKEVLPALLGILFFLPLIAVTASLLVSADSAFESFVQGALNFINLDMFMSYIRQLLLGIPVAFYLYGLIFGNVKGRHTDRINMESVDNTAKSMEIAPEMTIFSALTAFNLLYAVFFAVQAAYFFSAFRGNLPEAFSYAEYARRGFFELCAVAGINLGVLLISHLLIRRKPDVDSKVLRIETVLISMFTMLLITTALSKMVMYIGAYGLTQLRVFTSWFMLLLFFIFAVICVRQLKRFNAARLIIIGFVCLFMALAYSNVDGLIAKYNISRYEAGTLPSFDFEMIGELSDAAVPYLYSMYLRSDDAEMRQCLSEAINSSKPHAYEGFREFNLQKYRADEIRVSLSGSMR